LFEIAVNPDISLLEEGRFNSSNDGRQVLYFGDAWQHNSLRDVFLWKKSETGRETALMATLANVVEDEEGSSLVLFAGSGFLSDERNPEGYPVSFDRMEVPLQYGNREARSWTALFELDTFGFLKESPGFQSGSSRIAAWTSEALKRFIFPVLTIAYTFLGLALLSLRGDIINERQTIAICMIIVALHTLIVITIESGSHDAVMLGSGILMILLLFASIPAVTFAKRRVTRRPPISQPKSG
jgi:hypothetical protein